MFDVQVWRYRGSDLPADVLDSIAPYYRRVTTDARPMNRLIALAMLATLAALLGELSHHDVSAGVAWASLVLTAAAVGVAAVRTVRNAVRLGGQGDPRAAQSSLARTIFRDHLVCIAAIGTALMLQLAVLPILVVDEVRELEGPPREGVTAKHTPSRRRPCCSITRMRS